MNRFPAAAAFLTLACASVATPAAGQPCAMRTAVYTQESGYRLRFRPVSELQVAMATNAFLIEAPGRDRPLLGSVTWNNGESRPTGSAQLDCPEDATTGEDFADCTYWSGVMYALGEQDAVLLPGEDEPAPQAILLSDFGRKIRYSLIDDIGKETIPWDVFRLDRCD